MKDFLGNTLEVGDEVVFMRLNYRDLMKGKVVAFTPKNVRLGWKSKTYGEETCIQDPRQVVKIMK